MGDMPGGTRRERDIEPLADVPRVRVTGPDGTIRAHGHYGIFVDHMPGADGLVRDEWIHHVVLTRGFADWHMPCEPRLYEIQEDDVVEIDGEPKPSSPDDDRDALLARIRSLEEENRFLRDADAAWRKLASEWHDELNDQMGAEEDVLREREALPSDPS